ncbi:unnamed protein product [Orchesella dallaii]|uniref:Odorant receptor n=1 Tax=Orchesella dallaii TaxID=48710 RepID=A0ABP1PJJ0_9HEXA
MVSSNHNRIITPLIKTSIEIFNATYGKLYPFVLDIRIVGDSVPHLKWLKLRSWKLIPWFAHLIFVLGFTIIASGYSLLNTFSQPGRQLQLLEITHYTFWSCAWIFQLTISKTIISYPEIVPSFNYFFDHMCHQSFIRRHKDLDVPGLLLVYYILSSIFAILPFPAFVVALNLDYYHILFERFLLSTPYDRDTITIVFTTGIYIVLMFAAILEFVRIFSVTLMVVLLIGLGLQTCLESLLLRNYSERFTYAYYTYLRIIGTRLEDFVSSITLQCITLCLCALTTSSWMIIRGSRFLPIFCTLFAFIVFFGGLSFTIFFLRTAAKCRQLSCDLIDRKNRLYFSHNLKRCTYYYTVKWRAQKSLRVTCGDTRYVVDRKSPIDYLSVVMSCTTNAVLLVVP